MTKSEFRRLREGMNARLPRPWLLSPREAVTREWRERCPCERCVIRTHFVRTLSAEMWWCTIASTLRVVVLPMSPQRLVAVLQLHGHTGMCAVWQARNDKLCRCNRGYTWASSARIEDKVNALYEGPQCHSYGCAMHMVVFREKCFCKGVQKLDKYRLQDDRVEACVDIPLQD